MAKVKIYGLLDNGGRYSNLDRLFGPYDTLDKAREEISKRLSGDPNTALSEWKQLAGLTVGVKTFVPVSGSTESITGVEEYVVAATEFDPSTGAPSKFDLVQKTIRADKIIIGAIKKPITGGYEDFPVLGNKLDLSSVEAALDDLRAEKQSKLEVNLPNPTTPLTSLKIGEVNYVITGGGGGSVISVNGKTGAVVLNSEDINTTDTTPITLQAALNKKIERDQITGKLPEETELANIEYEADPLHSGANEAVNLPYYFEIGNITNGKVNVTAHTVAPDLVNVSSTTKDYTSKFKRYNREIQVLPEIPSTGAVGTYVLKAFKAADGTITYAWDWLSSGDVDLVYTQA